VEATRGVTTRLPGIKVVMIIVSLDDDDLLNALRAGAVHASKPGRVTVAGKPSDDLHPKTQTSILRQAGLRR
jgi:hypothetical protein